VYVVEPIGSEALVGVQIGETRVTVRTHRDWERPIGAPVGIRIDPATACFFDAEGRTDVHRRDRKGESGPGRGEPATAGHAGERSG
ncbi:MAG: hypothetical protein H0V20_02285, partial [Actinobacteria bacterium]|nr:hypothetical protein [Actinomycetota bacterium]